MHDDEALREGARMMRICNACRYCEGYCAVFPAMEKRLQFPDGDLNYLANLCHDCGECYYACQYAPPHEFAVNVPRIFAQIRARSYRQYAWPRVLAGAFARNGLALSLVLAALLGLALAAGLSGARPAVADGDFYRVLPHGLMVAVFGAVSLFVVLALGAGLVHFWRDMERSLADFLQPAALAGALWDALTLEYLRGGGAGCTYPDDRHSGARRWFHHLTFYSFALCFAATVVGTVYHYLLGWKAPYGYWSLPVVLGTLGGLGLLAGPAGLLWLKLRRDPEPAERSLHGMDVVFIALLFLTSLTGLALLVLRDTASMAMWLYVHLGCVMALFLSLPYGKFVHGIYRAAALVRYALEKSDPPANVGLDG